MLDAVRIAAIRHCFGEPQANTMFALPLPQKQHAAIGRLVAAGKIDGEFLASDRWQVERKRRIVSHSGCGAGLIREATCRPNDLLRESAAFRHSRRQRWQQSVQRLPFQLFSSTSVLIRCQLASLPV
jgi:hypothetical protein